MREKVQVWCAPSFGNCIKLFSLVKTLLMIDNIIMPSLEAKFKGHHCKGCRSPGICRGCHREIRPQFEVHTDRQDSWLNESQAISQHVASFCVKGWQIFAGFFERRTLLLGWVMIPGTSFDTGLTWHLRVPSQFATVFQMDHYINNFKICPSIPSFTIDYLPVYVVYMYTSLWNNDHSLEIKWIGNSSWN